MGQEKTIAGVRSAGERKGGNPGFGELGLKKKEKL